MAARFSDLAPSVAVTPIQLRLLGGFRLAYSGQALRPGMSEQRLLAYLALRSHGTRSQVAGTLWPFVAEPRAQACLRTALWRLGRLNLGLVEERSKQLYLGRPIWSDIRELDRWISGQAKVSNVPAVALRGGDLLPDWGDEWVLLERERLRQLRLHALEQAARELAEQHRYAEALDFGLEAIRAEPLRETAHRTVILIHFAEGNVAEAMRQYRVLSELLRTELSVAPSTSLRKLVNAELTRRCGAVIPQLNNRAASATGEPPIKPERSATPSRQYR